MNPDEAQIEILGLLTLARSLASRIEEASERIDSAPGVLLVAAGKSAWTVVSLLETSIIVLDDLGDEWRKQTVRER